MHKLLEEIMDNFISYSKNDRAVYKHEITFLRSKPLIARIGLVRMHKTITITEDKVGPYILIPDHLELEFLTWLKLLRI